MRAPLGPADRRDAVLGAQVAELRDARRGGAPEVDAVAQTHLGYEPMGITDLFGWLIVINNNGNIWVNDMVISD